jgi:large subunit ribosomal protein L13
LLLGKGKPTVTPHVDGGDYVIVINSSRLIVTGNKQTDKKYHRHSGFPGGLYTRSLNEQMARDPNKVIFKAVRGMLPDNKLRDGRLARLKIYSDDQHNHSAQKPQTLSLKKGNK